MSRWMVFAALLAIGDRGDRDAGPTGTGSAAASAERARDASPPVAVRALVPAALADWTADRWCRLADQVSGGQLLAFAPVAPDRLWAVGVRGLVRHGTGRAFEQWRLGPGALHTVATDGSDTWVLGQGIRRAPSRGRLDRALGRHAVAPRRVTGRADRGCRRHSRAAARARRWRREPARRRSVDPRGTGLDDGRSLAVGHGDELWAAAWRALARRSQGAWRVISSPNADEVRAIATSPTGTLFVAARDTVATAALHRWDGTAFVRLAAISLEVTQLAALDDRTVVLAAAAGAAVAVDRRRGGGVAGQRRACDPRAATDRRRAVRARPRVPAARARHPDTAGPLAWRATPIQADRIAGHAGTLRVLEHGSGARAVRAR